MRQLITASFQKLAERILFNVSLAAPTTAKQPEHITANKLGRGRLSFLLRHVELLDSCNGQHQVRVGSHEQAEHRFEDLLDAADESKQVYDGARLIFSLLDEVIDPKLPLKSESTLFLFGLISI